MVEFLEENQILCDNQHGFRSGRSCLTQLLSHVNDIVQGLSSGVDTDAIYLDFAEAFDKVDHQLLLLKMNKLGFHERVTKWVESFLSKRQQSVVVDGVSSFKVPIQSEVPQGTVLGPLLFIIFINDMKLSVKGSMIKLFADDTRILEHIAQMTHEFFNPISAVLSSRQRQTICRCTKTSLSYLFTDITPKTYYWNTHLRFSVRHTKSPMEISFIQSKR